MDHCCSYAGPPGGAETPRTTMSQTKLLTGPHMGSFTRQASSQSGSPCRPSPVDVASHGIPDDITAISGNFRLSAALASAGFPGLNDGGHVGNVQTSTPTVQRRFHRLRWWWSGLGSVWRRGVWQVMVPLCGTQSVVWRFHRWRSGLGSVWRRGVWQVRVPLCGTPSVVWGVHRLRGGLGGVGVRG